MLASACATASASSEPTENAGNSSDPVSIASSISPHAINVVDEDGDLILLLRVKDGADIKFQVSSHALRRASLVFHAMLAPGTFGEGADFQHHIENPDLGPYTLAVEDDEPDAMKIVLDALHLRNYHVPSNPDPETLFSIAVLVEKYDLAQALCKWGETWCLMLASRFFGALFIAWAFRNHLVFDRIAARTVLGCCLVNGELMYGGFNLTTSSSHPSSVTDLISASAEYAVSTIYRKLDSFLEAYQTSDQCYLAGEERGTFKGWTSAGCDAMYLGVYTKFLGKKHYLPNQRDPKTRKSLHTMRSDLQEVSKGYSAFVTVPCKRREHGASSGCRLPAKDWAICPGHGFHYDCNRFIPLVDEIFAIIDNVGGPRLAMFESRKRKRE